jgi:hypothetical protein
MEEELKNTWITNIQEYRNIYNNWIDDYCNGKNSEYYENLMWEEFSIYTDNNQLDYQFNADISCNTWSLVFKIKDYKKFIMARLKYDF